MKSGDRVLAFDKFSWIFAGRPEDKESFWKPARIDYINPYYSDLATITWDDTGGTSHGHHLDNLKLIGILGSVK